MTPAITYADALILFIDAEKASTHRLLDDDYRVNDRHSRHYTQDLLSFNESPLIAMAMGVK